MSDRSDDFVRRSIERMNDQAAIEKMEDEEYLRKKYIEDLTQRTERVLGYALALLAGILITCLAVILTYVAVSW